MSKQLEEMRDRGEREKQSPPCNCCHDTAEGGVGDQIPEVLLLLMGILMLGVGIIWEDFFSESRRWVFFGVPYLICGLPVLLAACQSLTQGRFFDEFTLMSGATLAALTLGELPEALGVMIFYRIGEMLQEQASGNTRRSIRNLLAQKPQTANILEGERVVSVPSERIQSGMKIFVKGGERIPADGVVLEGEARVDTSSISGESVPVRIFPGKNVYGGTICLDGTLIFESSSNYENSTIARIMEMVENAAERKSPTERFLTKFAATYTPVMFGLAFLTALLPPLLLGGSWNTWIYRALVVLMISCPCALVISIPLGYFGGLGAASKRGILVKGSYVLDAMTEITAVAFDKTGTLTRGVFEVTQLLPAPGIEENDLKNGALIAESASNHPVARSILKAFSTESYNFSPVGFESNEIGGKGVIANYKGHTYAAGNISLMHDLGIDPMVNEAWGTVVYVAKDSSFLGSIIVSDIIKADSVRAIARLHAEGLKCYMLTGDRKEGAAWVAKKLELDGYRAGLLPDQKVSAFEALAGSTSAAFVGDGFNDAPVLAASRIGFAMGGLGSEAAIEVADVVLLNDAPSRVADLVDVARRTRNIVRQNIVAALAVKGVFMALGILGVANLWEALFADVGVALLAILNSSRAGNPVKASKREF